MGRPKNKSKTLVDNSNALERTEWEVWKYACAANISHDWEKQANNQMYIPAANTNFILDSKHIQTHRRERERDRKTEKEHDDDDDDNDKKEQFNRLAINFSRLFLESEKKMLQIIIIMCIYYFIWLLAAAALWCHNSLFLYLLPLFLTSDWMLERCSLSRAVALFWIFIDLANEFKLGFKFSKRYTNCVCGFLMKLEWEMAKSHESKKNRTKQPLTSSFPLWFTFVSSSFSLSLGCLTHFHMLGTATPRECLWT